MSHWSVQAWMTGASLTISPKESLRQARALLRTAKVRELLVVDGGKLVGIVSERDIWAHCPTSALVLDDKQADELLARIRVGGVMALHPPTITLDTPLSEAARLLAASGRQGLPVAEDGVPIGLLTEDRVMQAVAALLKEIETRDKEEGRSSHQ